MYSQCRSTTSNLQQRGVALRPLTRLCRVSWDVIVPGGAVVMAEFAMLVDELVGVVADVALVAELAAITDVRVRRCDCRHSYRMRRVYKEQ